MNNKRMQELLYNCVEYIQESIDCPKMILHDACGFTDAELTELGFDWLTNDDEEDDDIKTRYYVCGISYDENDCVLDDVRNFGDFDTMDEADECFETAIREAEDDIKLFFRDDEPEVKYWLIQLEKCRETKSYIECTDVVREYVIEK